MAVKNYLKVFADGHTEATKFRPMFQEGERERAYAGENPDVLVDGKWFSSTNGSELLSGGNFDSQADVDLWTTENFYSKSLNNGTMQISRNGGADTGVYLAITTEIGVTYKLKAVSTEQNYNSKVGVGYTNVGMEHFFLTLADAGELDFSFTATTNTTYITLSAVGNVNAVASFDNISVFETGIVPDTVYPTQFTYLSKDDKLASFLIEGGQPVDIKYEDDAPSIVQNVIQAKDIKVTGEFKGKNACTAWVNFDGTTTPPTIRDSFNISSVVRLGTGIYDVYFETDMDNVNYSSVATNNISSTGVSSNKLDNFIHKVTLTTSKYNAASSATINSVHILGGRNNA